MITAMPRRRVVIALMLLMIAAACDGSPAAPDTELPVAEIIVADAATGEHVAYSHQDHWHGALRQRVGDARQYRVFFTARQRGPNEHDVPARAEWSTLDTLPAYQLHTVVQDTTVARWSLATSTGTLATPRSGATYVSFVVRRGTTTIFEAPPLVVGVTP